MSLKEHPELRRVILEMLKDEAHPMDICKSLRSEVRQQYVLSLIKTIADHKEVSEEEFKAIVEQSLVMKHYRFRQNQDQLNQTNGKCHLCRIREQLLEQDRDLFSIDDNPSEIQARKLALHVSLLESEIAICLWQLLERLTGAKDENGFPCINV